MFTGPAVRDLPRPLAHLRASFRYHNAATRKPDNEPDQYVTAIDAAQAVHALPFNGRIQTQRACIVGPMTDTTKPSHGFSILGLDHVVLRVKDRDQAIAFYCNVLGCTVERTVDDLGLVQLRAGHSLIDLVAVDSPLGAKGGPAPGKSGNNMDHFCIRIAPFSFEDLKNHLASHGIDPGEVGRRYGADGYGPSLYITDPDGNTVELKGPPEDDAA